MGTSGASAGGGFHEEVRAFKIDPADGTVLAIVTLEDFNPGAAPRDGWMRWFTWYDGQLWAGWGAQFFNDEDQVMVGYDPETGSIARTIPTPTGTYQGIAHDETGFYVLELDYANYWEEPHEVWRVHSGRRPWASANRRGGEIAAAAQDSMPLRLDSSGLPPGTFSGSVHVHGNDPDNPHVVVPVRLTVVDNRRPVITAGPTAVLNAAATGFDLAVAAEDPDGDPLTVQWTTIAAPAGGEGVIAVGSQPAVTASATVDQVGDYDFQVHIDDGRTTPVQATTGTATVPARATGIQLTP